MEQFFTWSFLATFAGAGVGTAIVTQFLKGALPKVYPQVLSYLVAIVILAVATAATGGAEAWSDWAAIPLNAILISLASNGGHQAVQKATEGNG